MAAPKGKHMFGIVTVGERGQIVIPKKARTLFDIKPGDSMMILGNEEGQFPGLAMIKNDIYMDIIEKLLGSSGMTSNEKEFVDDVIDAQKKELE
ncbi:MAG: AbrB/MazE/SpoVT family DNA-binding domain-containing protein [Lachnospiraceae bacterium]